MPITTMASSEVIEKRKRDAEAKSARFGHRIGNWQLEQGQHPTWRGVCLNTRCQSVMTMSPLVNGIAVGISATSKLAQCPYVRR